MKYLKWRGFMQVEISEEVQKIIIELCDLALRSGGLKNKPYVDKVLELFKNENSH
jgi:hypothetical protein